MQRITQRLSKLCMTLGLSLALLAGMAPSAQALNHAPALVQPAELSPALQPEQPATEQDFSDADFTTADQPELGAKTGGASRLTQEEWILIIGGALLLLIILIIIF